MAAMNHERLALRRRINREAWARKAERDQETEPSWLPIGWGKYAKLTIPELFFRDPGYFYWALCNNRFHSWVGYQAEEVDRMSKHMLPPRPRPSDWEFLITLKNGVFHNFRIVRMKTDTPKHSDGFVRVRHLDMSIVSRPGRAMSVPRRKMVDRIKEEFFPQRKLTRWAYQEFFDTDENFDPDCRETHCPRIARR